MLTPNPKKYAQHTRARQKGVMLLITLIMLVAMTLAAIALVSSVDTSNLVSGNMAFQQTTIDAANLGTDQAISYIYNPATNFVKNCKSTSPGANCINGYKSWHEKTLEPPTAGQTWDGFWAKVKQVSGTAPLTGLPPDYSGAFVIEAMCSTDMAGAGGGS